MTSEEAIQFVAERFPFKGHIHPRVRGVYLIIAKTVLRYMQPGSKILDFGSGPCDKTAVLQTLGYKCSACDDFQDDWHRIEENREKIIAFTKDFGINFKVINNNELPFEKHYFDMLMMHHVLEHIQGSPRDLLNDLLKLVKPEGLIFVVVPNAVNIRKRVAVLFGKSNYPRFGWYYWYPGPWRGHVREYVKDDLIKLCKYLNLGIIELRSCHGMLFRIPTAARMVYLPITKIFPGWRDSWLLVAKKRPDWMPNKTQPPDEALREFPKVTEISNNL